MSLLMVLCALIACSGLDASLTEDEAHTQTRNGLVTLEAEAFHANTSPGLHTWRPLLDGDASGGEVMQALPNEGENREQDYTSSSPRLDYTVDFNRAGVHYVWVRGKAAGEPAESDSVHVGLDAAAQRGAEHVSGFGADFTWEKGTADEPAAQISVPSAGRHTLNVWMREDGFVLDKVILTPDANFTPHAVAEDGGEDAVTKISFSAPLVISEGGTYSGNWESQDPDEPAVVIKTSEPVVIEDATIRSRGHLIYTEHGRNADVTVRNVKGYGLNPDRSGQHAGRFLVADTYAFVRVENSYLEGTSGIWLHHSRPRATVKILRNSALNIDGRLSDGAGGWRGGNDSKVQFVQFDKGVNLVDTEVAWNQIINEPYKSRVEDVINIYRTNGTASSPIRIHNNYIQGAYPANPAKDDFSGGGILLGDAGGAHLHAFNNQVVSTANYGVAIAGGKNNKIYNNRVLSSGRLADGTPIASQNVGIYIWNQHSADYGKNVGYGNLSGWVKEEYTWNGGRNDWWVPDASQWKDNEHWRGKITRQTETEEFRRFRVKLTQADIVVGLVDEESLAQQ